MSDDNLFGANEARSADGRAWEEAKRQNRINLKAFLMTIAIVVAPFLALIISFDAALIVLATALGFTTWLTWHVANKVGDAQGSRLKVMAVMNFGVMLMVLLVLYVRLSG